jgi:hypothetical protein
MERTSKIKWAIMGQRIRLTVGHAAMVACACPSDAITKHYTVAQNDNNIFGRAAQNAILCG